MKLKNILFAAFLSVAVAIVFCGCGPSEEEVYEHLARVEEKANKIEKADLSMEQGFQEKWDLLKRKQAAADRAFSKNDYSTTAKFLQEAESAADWILNQGPLRAEADEKYSELESRKRNSNSSAINAPKYASTIYAEAEKYEQQGRDAYEKVEFEEAARLYVLAANEYKKAASTASVFHEFTQKTVTAREKTIEAEAARWAHKILMDGISDAQKAFEANAQGRYDEALQLLESAKNKFENAALNATNLSAAQQKTDAAKEKAKKVNAPLYASTIYKSADSYVKYANVARYKGEYKKAMGILKSAENKFENAATIASQFTAAKQKANAAKEKAFKEKAFFYASEIYQKAEDLERQAVEANSPRTPPSARDRMLWVDPKNFKLMETDEQQSQQDDVGKEAAPIPKKPPRFGPPNYDEALQLMKEAENTFHRAAAIASQFTAAKQKANSAKEKADKESAPSRYAPAIYQEAVAKIQSAIDANAQGKYDEALQLLESAVETFEKAEKEAAKNVLPYLIKSFVKIEEKNYYIGKYEVTQAQWKAVMGNNPAEFKGADRPVEYVSWHNAMHFCEKLNDLGLAPAGYQFSLPTDAQWEYAARGGNKSKGYEYSGSNDINEVAWYNGNSGRQTHPVGEKKPNELGLYDMSGNVWEWCLDADGSYRVLRGGSWYYGADGCQVADRGNNYPGRRGNGIGFRLALVPVQ